MVLIESAPDKYMYQNRELYGGASYQIGELLIDTYSNWENSILDHVSTKRTPYWIMVQL